MSTESKVRWLVGILAASGTAFGIAFVDWIQRADDKIESDSKERDAAIISNVDSKGSILASQMDSNLKVFQQMRKGNLEIQLKGNTTPEQRGAIEQQISEINMQLGLEDE